MFSVLSEDGFDFLPLAVVQRETLEQDLVQKESFSLGRGKKNHLNLKRRNKMEQYARKAAENNMSFMKYQRHETHRAQYETPPGPSSVCAQCSGIHNT